MHLPKYITENQSQCAMAGNFNHISYFTFFNTPVCCRYHEACFPTAVENQTSQPMMFLMFMKHNSNQLEPAAGASDSCFCFHPVLCLNAA